jgi:DNA modification methylase
MKVYYETKLGKLYHCDCEELTNNIIESQGEKAIDLTLTDPPYGIGLDYDNFDDTREELVKLINRTMSGIIRASKRVLLSSGQSNMWLYPEPKWVLAWVFPTGNGNNPWGWSCWHPILAYGPDPYLEKGMGCRPDIIWKVDHRDVGLDHPCPKPTDFWTKLLLRGSVSESDTIYDPFFGSGTTGISCERHKRKWIGCDISEKYCEVAARRIEKELTQLNLF